MPAVLPRAADLADLEACTLVGIGIEAVRTLLSAHQTYAARTASCGSCVTYSYGERQQVLCLARYHVAFCDKPETFLIFSSPFILLLQRMRARSRDGLRFLINWASARDSLPREAQSLLECIDLDLLPLSDILELIKVPCFCLSHIS